VYLGKKYDVTYRFGDILALPSNFKPNMVSKKSTGSVIGSTMLVVKEKIW